MTLRIILLLDVQRHLYGVRGLFGKYLKCPYVLERETILLGIDHAHPQRTGSLETVSVNLSGPADPHLLGPDGDFTDGDAKGIHPMIIVQR